MTINLQEVVDYIATLPPSAKSVAERVAGKYPLDRDECIRVAGLLRAQAKELARERAALERVASIVRRYGFGPGSPKMTLGEAAAPTPAMRKRQTRRPRDIRTGDQRRRNGAAITDRRPRTIPSATRGAWSPGSSGPPPPRR